MEEEWDKLLHRNIFSLECQTIRLNKLLTSILPQKGNFLFTDLIGRIVWHTCATSNTLLILAKNHNDYGIKSLSRKVFECYLLLTLLFNSKEKSKEIAKILCSEFRRKKNLTEEESILIIEKLVYSFEENETILDEFKAQIKQRRNHWHWSGISFRTMIKDFKDESSYMPDFDKEMIELKLKLLNSYNENAHVDFSLDEDFLEDNSDGTYQYKNPNDSSKILLYKYLGLIRLILGDIEDLLRNNRNSYFTTTSFPLTDTPLSPSASIAK
jgi:hypothetical protein